MVKYLSFHNSSFAFLSKILFNVKWHDHNVTQPPCSFYQENISKHVLKCAIIGSALEYKLGFPEVLTSGRSAMGKKVLKSMTKRLTLQPM